MYDPKLSKKEQDDKINSMIEVIWEEYDTDRNGVLDFHEIKKFIVNLYQTSGITYQFSEQELYDLFRCIDKTDNNTVSKYEMEVFLKSIGSVKVTAEKGKRIWTSMVPKTMRSGQANKKISTNTKGPEKKVRFGDQNHSLD